MNDRTLLSLTVVSLTLTNYNLPEQLPVNFLRDSLWLIDYWGILTLVLGTSAIVLGLSLGGNVYEWTDTWVIVSLVLGTIVLSAFVIIEKKVAECPIMPVEVLVQRTPFGCYMTNFFASMTSITSVYMIPLYFQVRSPSSVLIAFIRSVLVTFTRSILITFTRNVTPMLFLENRIFID